jgi:uncharacterized repeat protein (TIGR01451 family)
MGNSIPGEAQLMRRLIRQLTLTAGMLLLLTGPALAQVVQNTASGELNLVSLEESRATVTLNRVAGNADPGTSSVTVNPPVVVADGTEFSTITVTLRDAAGLPLAGRMVSLASSRGAVDVVTQPLNPTDANGVTSGEIRSTQNGIAQIQATDVVDGVLINELPEVLFASTGALQLTKTVNPDRATIGDVVTYTIEIRNTTASTIGNVLIIDEAAPVLAYLPGTARLDGTVIAEPLPGPPMVFNLGDVQALADGNGNGVADPGEGGYYSLSYSMVVGAGARVGAYSNLAVANAGCVDCALSLPVSVDLDITADPLFDLGTVIGKVFNDVDGDGWQDRGEPGIANAMVALDTGTYVLTDAHGRYHFPAILPGQRMVKLNLNSIDGNASAIGSDKKVLTVTPGLLAKANFGVTYGAATASIGHGPMPLDGVDVTLMNADSNAILYLAEKQQVEPLRFTLHGNVPGQPVDRWTLRILGEDGFAVKSLTGQGELPDHLIWDDITEIQALLKPGSVYGYQLEIEQPEQHVFSPRRMFGVIGDTAATVRLSGGAFVFDTTDLTGSARNLLGEVADLMRLYPDGLVQIKGHTDPSGSRGHNQRLSVGRATAAFDYLVNSLGFAPDRFIVKGMGEDQPLVSNDSEVGRSINRRVEITLQFTDIERARVYGTKINDLLAIMYRDVMGPGEYEQFDKLIAGSGVQSVDQQQSDTATSMPLLQDLRLLDSNDRQHAYRLVARTDSGNHVELDGQPLKVDAGGQFESRLNLLSGPNALLLTVRNAQGFVRYANLQVLVDANNNDVTTVTLGPSPKLVLQLPPEGVAMRNANLLVPGFTDPGNSVRINGQAMEVDDKGQFMTNVPLHFGSNSIDAVVIDGAGNSGGMQRDIEYSGNSMFIMALAEGTVSQITREGNLQAAGADSIDEVRTEGRVAMYMKGTVLGKYLITAAFDSGSGDTDTLFRDLDSIENERLITNLDPDTIYPVYGDDSTLVYDTESQGKLYLALEGERLEAVVGNYALNFTDTELTAYQRTLYGARAAWRSKGKTHDNASNTEVDLFVAEVDQVPVRDELAATGGSLYFLSQNEIIQGSEQVSLLVHDQHTGLLLKRITQQRNVDYNIKYREGRIWFSRPISSVVANGTLIGSNMLAGNPVTIQVDYEMPVDGLEAAISGARFKQRFADGRLSIGGIHVEDNGGSGAYTLDGLDMEVKLQTARIVAEYAQSEGTDSLVFRSTDGGLQFSPETVGVAAAGAAYKVAAEFDAGAWFGAPERLLGSAYYKHDDGGFIGNGNSLSLNENRQYGAELKYQVSDIDSVLVRVDDQWQGAAMSATQTTVNWRHSRERLVLEGEYVDRQVSTAGASGAAVALRAQFDWADNLTASLEHQEALSGDSGTQSAAGVEFAIREKLLLSGRIVMADDGEAFQGGASWDTPLGRLYAQQRLTGTESSDDSGNTVLGAEAPFGAGGTVYSEYQWDRTGERRGLRAINGIRRDWAVTEGLSVLVSAEQTLLQMAGGGEDELHALVGGASFDRNGVKLRSRNEWRRQQGISSLEQFASFNYGEVKLRSGFTLLGEYRLSKSEDMLVPDQSTDFEEASLGFAIRPIDHDRWNVLFKVSSLDSEATPAQIDSRYDTSSAMLLSTDWSLQLHRRIEWVGKQAFKRKLTELPGLSEIETNTSLSIQRFNVAMPWDFSIGAEYRRLYQEEADDTRSGFLGELMWNHFEHVGLGVGYNFTEFSSELRFDSEYSEYGWFFRLQGRY